MLRSFPVGESITTIYLFFAVVFWFHQGDKWCYVPGVSYPLAYSKYLNKYALTTNAAYVTYVNTFACLNYSLGGVGHCFTWLYKSALVFISILKLKNLYIVGCVQCDKIGLIQIALISYAVTFLWLLISR